MWNILLAAALSISTIAVSAIANAQTVSLPDRVTFASADGHTTLVGYVFKPQGPHATRMAAVVMMHGRAGAYSSLANGNYGAATLSKRHQEWGHLWAQQGYVAILVDGFGPRGYPEGFGRFSYDQRPEELSEVTVRPLDAYGALAYLRARRDVVPDRIGLQGWSNGGSAALATMSVTAPGIVIADAGHRLSRCPRIVPRLRLEGTIRQRAHALRTGASTPRLCRRRSIASPLRGVGR